MDSISLTTLAQDQLALPGRPPTVGPHTVHGGHDRALRETVLALAAGHELAEHESPGEATVQVLHGRVRLTTNTDSWEGTSGDHVAIPPERHGLAALEDSVIPLTVVSPR